MPGDTHCVFHSSSTVSLIVELNVSIVNVSTGTGSLSTYVLSLPPGPKLQPLSSARLSCAVASVPVVTAAVIAVTGSASIEQNTSLVPEAAEQPKSAGKSVVP